VNAADRADFGAFVAARTPVLFRTALALTGHREQAEDVLQTALTRTVRHWGRIRSGNPEAYVRAAMVRTLLNRRRTSARRPEAPAAVLPERPGADPTEAADTGLVVAAALRRLPPRDRLLLTLRFYEDLPTDEIASLLDCPAGTVRSQLTRALHRLRDNCPELDLSSHPEETRR
jgi:RNA polymerase sigma-70 factor (sigma-E family)